MWQSSTMSGTRPAAPTASTWNGTPRARARRPISRTGWTVPISPLAAMIETSTVSSRMARATASGSTRPSASTLTYVIVQPRFSRSRHESISEMCSIAEVTTCRPGARWANPLMARLFASVALAVKITPAGAPANSRATLARAPSSDARASRPSECWAFGLPTPPSRNGRITATTRGSTGEKPA